MLAMKGKSAENGISFSTTVYVYDLGKMLFLIRVQFTIDSVKRVKFLICYL